MENKNQKQEVKNGFANKIKSRKYLMYLFVITVGVLGGWYFYNDIYSKYSYKEDFKKYCKKISEDKYICTFSELDGETNKIRNNISNYCFMNSAMLLGKVYDSSGISMCWGSSKKPVH